MYKYEEEKNKRDKDVQSLVDEQKTLILKQKKTYLSRVKCSSGKTPLH